MVSRPRTPIQKTPAYLRCPLFWVYRLSSWSGGLACVSLLALVLVISVDVASRYIFNTTYIWVSELEIYLFAMTFLFGAPFALKHDKHVRLDLFYEHATRRKKNWINLLGTLLFLLPWSILILVMSFDFAWNSWLIRESSSQAGGLPRLYMLKFSIVVCFFLLSIQGIAFLVRSIGKEVISQH